MQFDFTSKMKEATDAELLNIVTLERDNFQEEAVVAAEVELEKRNLTPEQIHIETTFNEKQQQIRSDKANTPLETHWKILTFLFPGIFQLILSGLFKGSGYDRKANELAKWTLFGVGFYIGLVIILSML